MASSEDPPRTPPAPSDRNLKKPLPALPKHGRARSVGGDIFGAENNQSGSSDADAYRNKILAELLSTERSYIASLEQLGNAIKVLRQAPPDVVTSKQTARLTSNTEMLLNFHRSGLLPQLENLIGRKAPDVNVGSVIISFMPFLKATYAQFVNNYSFAIATLKELVANPRFLAYISANWKSDGPGSSFESYVDLRLITPVQRIPRYELLLKDLLRHTPHEHHEYATLTEAYNKVKEVAEFVNEKKAEAERMQQLLSLQSSLREDQHRQSIVLAQPGRFLISETRVIVHRSSQIRAVSAGESALSQVTLGAIGGHSAPREGKVIMFNDCVLIARKKNVHGSTDRLTFSALLYIKPLVVQDLGGLDFSLHAERDALRTSIVKEGKTFRFSAMNEAQKTQLLTAIRDARELLTSKEALGKRHARPRLHFAIKKGDMAAIQEVVKNDPASVNAVDRKGHTALHAAVKKQDQELVKYLLAQGASTKVMAHDGLTPIDLATKLGDEAMLLILQPKLRTQRQDEGFMSGVTGVATAAGSLVGKGLVAPLRMFKRDENTSSGSLKREPSATADAPAGTSAAAADDGASPEKAEGKSTDGKSTDMKKEGSRRSLITIPLLTRSQDKEKDKDKAERGALALPQSASAPPMSPTPAPAPASPMPASPLLPPSPAREPADEERIKLLTTRIGDIDLHMAALAHERSALLAELKRLQPSAQV